MFQFTSGCKTAAKSRSTYGSASIGSSSYCNRCHRSASLAAVKRGIAAIGVLLKNNPLLRLQKFKPAKFDTTGK
jgi:hypothetical protein